MNATRGLYGVPSDACEDPPVPPPAQHAADEAHDGPCQETLVKAEGGAGYQMDPNG